MKTTVYFDRYIIYLNSAKTRINNVPELPTLTYSSSLTNISERTDITMHVATFTQRVFL